MVKKHADITELRRFLTKESFTAKEEHDIWAKFGNLIGCRKYYMNWHRNRAEVISEGETYFYLVTQVSNVKNSSVLFTKIDPETRESVWASPVNAWNVDLVWNGASGSWIQPTAPQIYSPEEDAISVVESVLMASYKKYNKEVENSDSKTVNPYLTFEDFAYQYVGSDGSWHAFCPSTQKITDYCAKFNRPDFLNFITSDDSIWARKLLGLG